MNEILKPRIAIDMDEVLADTLSQFLSGYNREFGENLTKADLTERKLAEIIPADRRARLRHYALSPGFFRDIAGAVRSLHRHRRHGISQLVQREVPVDQGPFPLVSRHSHRFLWRQERHLNRLSD
jgi:hypothetical protein